jgi:hypothetical protein
VTQASFTPVAGSNSFFEVPVVTVMSPLSAVTARVRIITCFAEETAFPARSVTVPVTTMALPASAAAVRVTLVRAVSARSAAASTLRSK